MAPSSPASQKIHSLISNRWSPYHYAPKAVEPATLARLFEAARWAPSSFNEQPWRFIYAHREDTDQFNQLADCLFEGNRAWAEKAPVLILALTSLHFSRNGKVNRHAFHDLGLAMGNFMLQATQEGLHGHQMAGFDVEKARQAFDLPSELEPVTMTAVGYLGSDSDIPEPLKARQNKPRQRKPLSEIVHHGQLNAGLGSIQE